MFILNAFNSDKHFLDFRSKTMIFQLDILRFCSNVGTLSYFFV